MKYDVLLRSTKWNANLILLCDYAELVALCKVIKADVNFFGPIKHVSLRKLAPSCNAIITYQTGMDFVTEISFCKTPVVDEARLVFRG